MSSSHVNLSSDLQSYARDTPANQEFVDESQTATPAEIALQEGLTFACEAIQATKAGLSKKKKKRILVKGANLPPSSEATPGDKAGSSQDKDKQGDCSPNTVPLADMPGKRPIAFKKVKVVNKVASSPRPSTTAGLPPRPSPATNIAHSSPIPVESDNSSFSPPISNLADELPSSSRPSKRPSKGVFLKGSRNKPRQVLSFLIRVMVAGFFTPEFLALPYTLPGGQQICEGTSFKSNLQPFHAVANAGFELARRADCIGEENKHLKAEVPFEKTASLD
ncbi:hypothetical protein LIER_10001 [Lithospermum erythrorhizon]|uniref:Uncharacterized protein n=1 Tax=Lithospermum erythrorhizon TaxID=34254 RepID=A0AAV3PJR5_LITER